MQNATKKRYLLIGLVTGISVFIYLFASHFVYRVGFPLDDAWIHQTYARNLAVRSEWAFIPGQVSAGSTAPLWSALLAFGFFVNLAPYAWTYFLGWLILVFVAILGAAIFERLEQKYLDFSLWVSLFLVLEWHLVWSATSGMETILAISMILVFFWLLLDKDVNWFLPGLIAGLFLDWFFR